MEDQRSWINRYPGVLRLWQQADDLIDEPPEAADAYRDLDAARWYRLEGQTPVLTTAEAAVAAFLRDPASTTVAISYLPHKIVVHTTFLCLDHNRLYSCTPKLFASLIVGSPMDGCVKRSTTWQEAQEWHAVIVAMVRMWLQDMPMIGANDEEH